MMTQTAKNQTLTGWNKYTLPDELRNPAALPAPTSFGDEWAVVAKGANRPGLFDLIFMLIWLTFSGWQVLAIGSHSALFALFPLLFVVIGLGMLYDYIQKWNKYRQSQRLGSPILLLNQERYRPGDPLRLSFQRDIKPNTEVGAGTLSARLVCVEVTRRTVGTDTSYDHVLHFEKDLGQQPTFGGQHQLRALWHADIPADARPSQRGSDHWLVWEVQVRQHLTGQLDETTSFLIPVVN